MKTDQVKSGSIRIEATTLEKLKEFVGKTGKINAHANIAILQYIENAVAK
jgi:hypothetical protein